MIADTEKELLTHLDVGAQKFMGKEYDGILRKTFVIENGAIAKVFEKVKTSAHFEQIMKPELVRNYFTVIANLSIK